MKKISILYGIFFLLILLLKFSYIETLDRENNFLYVSQILMLKADYIPIEIIWYAPILLNTSLISSYFYERFTHFEMRYSSRKKYIKKELKQFFLFSFLFQVIIGLIEVLFFSYVTHFSMEFQFVIPIIHYSFENTLLIFVVILFSIFLRNFLCGFLISNVILFLFLYFPFSFLQKVPIFHLFFSGNINVFSIFLLLLLFFQFYFIYLKLDLLGEDFYEN